MKYEVYMSVEPTEAPANEVVSTRHSQTVLIEADTYVRAQIIALSKFAAQFGLQLQAVRKPDEVKGE